MKVLNRLFLLLALSFTMISCGSDAEKTEDPVQKGQTTAPQKVEQTTPPSTQKTESAETSPGVDPNSDAAEKARAGMVESTQKIEEAPVDDSAIDYKKLAASICQCSAKHKGVDDGQKGGTHVSKSDTDYQKEVDCAIKAKNDMSTGEISRRDLVGAIKNECGDIPGKLVMRIMMTLAK